MREFISVTVCPSRRAPAAYAACRLTVSLVGLLGVSTVLVAGQPRSGHVQSMAPPVRIRLADLPAPDGAPPPLVRPRMPGPPPRPVPADAVIVAETVPTPGGASAFPPLAGPPSGSPPPGLSPTPAVSFQALPDDDTAIPPDTFGAVGPNHVMTALNTQVRIQTRQGVVLFTTSLNAFWASAMNPAPSTFDPRVLYDPYAGRWIFVCTANARAPSSAVLVGVSTSSDPTAGFLLYSIDADAANTAWADYPIVGYNKDWIVVTVNMFQIGGGGFVESRIFVFNKASAYGGALGAVTSFADPQAFSLAPAEVYSPTQDTVHLIEDFNGNFAGSGFLSIATISGAVGAEVYTPQVFMPSTPNPWSFISPGGADFAPQLGTTQRIDAGDARMQQALFRNGSLWCTQTIYLPAGAPTRSAVQWWQLNPANGAIVQRGRVDDATAVPRRRLHGTRRCR